MQDQDLGRFASPHKPEPQRLASIDAEQALIGALMFDPSLLEQIPPLEPGQFFDPAHGLLWGRVTGLIRSGRVADAISLRDWWLAQPCAEALGGKRYLIDLLDRAARLSAHAIEYARVVAATASLRELQSAFAKLQGLITSGASPIDVVGEAEAALRAVPLPGASEGRSLRQAAHKLIASLDDPNALGVATGLEALDRRLGGLYAGGLFLLAGRPSMGKTALATTISRDMAGRGLKGHFASYEMGDEQIAARSLAAASFASERDAFAYSELRRGASLIDRRMLARLAASLPDTLVIEDNGAQTLAQLEASCRATARRLGGLDFVIVDYLQLMRPTTKGTRNDQITEISQGLKALAKRLRVPIVALSQLSRANEQRDDKRPQLSDLRDSGSLEQDADVVLGVYREHYYAIREEPRVDQIKADKERTAEENYSLALYAWEQRCAACERTVEVITLKQRNGDIGTDVFEFFGKYDVTRDQPQSSRQTPFRSSQQD